MAKFKWTRDLYAVGVAAIFIVAASRAFGAEVAYQGSWECDASPTLTSSILCKLLRLIGCLSLA